MSKQLKVGDFIVSANTTSQSRNDWQLTVYIPRSLRAYDPLDRLKRTAIKERRSMNFLAVEALLKYLDQVEERGGSNTK